MRAFLALILAILIASCAKTNIENEEQNQQTKKSKFTKRFIGSLYKNSQKGFFIVAAISKENPTVGVNALELLVYDKNEISVTGANITVTPWMSEMGHGVLEMPIITEIGGGIYRVENIMFNMAGHWELRIKVKKAETEDAVFIDFYDIKKEQN